MGADEWLAIEGWESGREGSLGGGKGTYGGSQDNRFRWNIDEKQPSA